MRKLVLRTIAHHAGFVLMLVLATSVVLAHSAWADELTDIKQKGVIRIGVLSSEPPWGFTDASGQPTGVDIDVANLLAADLGVKADMVPIIVASRIPTLMTGKVDVLIASLGMFPDRAKVIQFTRPYIADSNIVAAAKDKPIKGYDDLKNFKVGVNRGTVMDIEITKNAPAGTQILRFDDDASAVQAMRSGQVDAVGLGIFSLKMMDETSPGHPYELKFVINNQWTGIGHRKGEKQLNAYLNDFLDRMEKAGKLNEISKKYLNVDAPVFPKEGLPGITFSEP